MFLMLLACSPDLGVTALSADASVKADDDLDGYDSSVDCDDTRRDVYPGAPERCDNRDNNCNRLVDEGVRVTFFRDTDRDGYGGALTVDACSPGPGRVLVGGDCDDRDFTVFPGAPEVCDGRDQNCDSVVDEGVMDTWYTDADGDAYGDPAAPVEACDQPAGAVADDTDCDDSDGAISPGATEAVNGLDDDCNGIVDDVALPFEIVFAGNLDNALKCDETSSNGCDLYRAELDPDTWEPISIERLTSVARAGEIFPTIERTGGYVAYESFSGANHGVKVIDLSTMTETAVTTDGRYPNFANVSDRLAYTDASWNLHLVDYTRTSGFAVSTDDAVGEARDPEFFPDDQTIIMHHRPDGQDTRTVLFDVPTATWTDFSDPDDTCAHGTVNDDASRALCQIETQILGRSWDGSSWSTLAEVYFPESASTYGDTYSACGSVTFSYPEFCGDTHTMAVSVNCIVAGNAIKSTLMLVDLDTLATVDLHGLIEDAYGVSSKSTRTIACTSRE